MYREVTSLQHPLVKHLVKIRQNRDYRYEHQSLVIEGVKPVSEICPLLHLKTLVVYDETLIPERAKADEVLLVPEEILHKISGMQHTEGILAEVAMPRFVSLKGKRRILALDGINDPGNLGTLLRTALALGWDGVFLLENTCDPFNEKALRAARGATFHLALSNGSWKNLKDLIQDNKMLPLVADLRGNNPQDLPLEHEKIVLILGNEATGPSAESERFQKVTIPMQEEMESLNVAVAGGILMYMLNQVRL